jgi:hypothetical protein
VPLLDITTEFVYGFIKTSDFIYLVHSDENQIPRFAQQLDHDRVYKLDESSFADNYGKVYIPLNIEKGAYKVYYCRK